MQKIESDSGVDPFASSNMPATGAVGATPTPAPTSSVAAVMAGPSTPSSSGTNQQMQSAISSLLKNDPTMLQQQEWLSDQQKTDLERAKIQAGWNEQEYQLALAKLQSSGGGGSSGALASIAAAEAADKKMDALHREQAAHDLALNTVANREALYSRGTGDSGQLAFSQGELKYNYDNVLKQLDIAAEQAAAQRAASRASIASAASSQQASLAAAMSSLQLAHSQDLTKAQWAIQDIESKYKVENGQIVMQTEQRVKASLWDEKTGTYIGPGGEQWDKFGNSISSAAPTVSTGPSIQYPVGTPVPIASGGPSAGSNALGNAYIR